MLAVLFRANWVGWPVDRVVGESGPRRLRACAVVLHVSVMAPAPAGGLGRACCPGRCASLPDHRVLGRPGRLVVACSVAGGACAWCLDNGAGAGPKGRCRRDRRPWDPSCRGVHGGSGGDRVWGRRVGPGHDDRVGWRTDRDSSAAQSTSGSGSHHRNV